MKSPASRMSRNALLRRLRLSARGQSMTEFAIVLPIMLGVFGAAIDYSRFNEQRVKLESATRDAAEYAATNSTSLTEAQTKATEVVCLQFGQPSTCTSPAVTASRPPPSTAAADGATTVHPLVTVSVTTSLDFETLFPYPFLTDRGAVTLTASAEYSILQGR